MFKSKSLRASIFGALLAVASIATALQVTTPLQLATIPIANLPTGGPIATAAISVDRVSSFTVSQTTAGQTLTLPNPGDTTPGYLALVQNSGTAPFTMYGTNVGTSNYGWFAWSGTAWTSMSTPPTQDYWRSSPGNTQPDGVNDTTEVIGRPGSVKIGGITSTALPAPLPATATNFALALENIGGSGATLSTTRTQIMRGTNPINYYTERQMPVVVNEFVTVANIAAYAGPQAFRLTVAVGDSGFSVAKMYNITSKYAGVPVWQEVQAASTTGSYSGQDFAVDVLQPVDVLSVRIRRTGGATVGIARITIESQGGSMTGMVETSTTGVETTLPVPILPYSSPGYFQTQTTLRGPDGETDLTENIRRDGSIAIRGDNLVPGISIRETGIASLITSPFTGAALAISGNNNPRVYYERPANAVGNRLYSNTVVPTGLAWDQLNDTASTINFGNVLHLGMNGVTSINANNGTASNGNKFVVNGASIFGGSPTTQPAQRVYVTGPTAGAAPPSVIIESDNCGAPCGQVAGAGLMLKNLNMSDANNGSKLVWSDAAAGTFTAQAAIGSVARTASASGIGFFTGLTGINWNERARFDGSGNFMLKTTTPSGDFTVNGTAFKTGGGAWSAISDRRMKTKITEFFPGLAAVQTLKTVEYNYTKESGQATDKRQVGLIAQDVHPVLAQYMVERGKEGIYTLDPSALTYVYANAIKELAERVKQLETKLLQFAGKAK